MPRGSVGITVRGDASAGKMALVADLLRRWRNFGSLGAGPGIGYLLIVIMYG